MNANTIFNYAILGFMIIFFGGFIVLGAIKLIRDVVKNIKNGTLTFDSFMDLYQEAVVNCLKEVLPLLQVDIDDYSSKEDYEKAIAEKGIHILKDKFQELGIPETVIAIFDDDALSNIIITIYHNNESKILLTLDKKEVDDHKELYDDDAIKELEAEVSSK